MYVQCARGQLELARERQTTEPEVKQTVMDGLTGTSEEETGRSQETQDSSVAAISSSAQFIAFSIDCVRHLSHC